jgi:hypothetical protein
MYYQPTWGGKCNASLILFISIANVTAFSHKAAAIAVHITEFSGDSGLSFEIRLGMSRRLGDALLSTDGLSWTKLSFNTRDHKIVAGL